MPLESLACTNCGSPDVKEVKAETYFCNQCDSVFKHVDPGKVTVAPAFCECGNPVARRCEICGYLMCHRCNALEVDHSGTPRLTAQAQVPTVGFGYGGSPHIFGDANLLIAGRLCASPPAGVSKDLIEGPRLDITSLFHHFMTANGNPTNACWSCIAATASDREVIEKLANRTSLCEVSPLHESRRLYECKCCRGTFCHNCIGPRRQLWQIEAQVYGLNAPSQTSFRVHCRPREHICYGCGEELSSAVPRILSEYDGILRKGRENYLYIDSKNLAQGKSGKSAVKTRLGRHQRTCDSFAVSRAAEIAADLNRKFADLWVDKRRCQLGRWRYYTVVDDRATTAPGPAPGARRGQ